MMCVSFPGNSARGPIKSYIFDDLLFAGARTNNSPFILDLNPHTALGVGTGHMLPVHSRTNPSSRQSVEGSVTIKSPTALPACSYHIMFMCNYPIPIGFMSVAKQLMTQSQVQRRIDIVGLFALVCGQLVFSALYR